MRPSDPLKDDAIKAAQVRTERGADYQLGIGERNGFPVVDVPNDFPLITSERVRELLDEEKPSSSGCECALRPAPATLHEGHE